MQSPAILSAVALLALAGPRAAHAGCDQAHLSILDDIQELEAIGYVDTMFDADVDGLPDAYELDFCLTDPDAADSDGDGIDDLVELMEGTDPMDQNDPPLPEEPEDEALNAIEALTSFDTDGDGLGDEFERRYSHTDPAVADAVLVAYTPAGCILYAHGNELVADFCNVHIRSGMGATHDGGAPTGRGNLVVGYNDGGGAATGSHNLVVGDGHSYTSFGGVALGTGHALMGPYAVQPLDDVVDMFNLFVEVLSDSIEDNGTNIGAAFDRMSSVEQRLDARIDQVDGHIEAVDHALGVRVDPLEDFHSLFQPIGEILVQFGCMFPEVVEVFTVVEDSTNRLIIAPINSVMNTLFNGEISVGLTSFTIGDILGISAPPLPRLPNPFDAFGGGNPVC